MSEKRNDMNAMAEVAWQKWHEGAGFDPDDDDDYIPEMPPMWRIAFTAGAEWAEAKGEK